MPIWIERSLWPIQRQSIPSVAPIASRFSSPAGDSICAMTNVRSLSAAIFSTSVPPS
jgi:hypothetical protein